MSSKTVENPPLPLRKKFWNNDTEAVVGIMIVLLILGTINVFSSSFILAETEFENPYHFLQRHLINIAVSFIAFGICLRVDYRILGRRKKLALSIVGAIFLSLILVLTNGDMINGARRWLSFGGMNVQPAEFCKLISIMITANYLSRQIKSSRTISLA